MIASEDVRRVTFEKAMRGYRCDDVDDYLRQVADSLDALSAENEDLQKKLVVLAQRIDQYRAEEDTLHTTLINAQRLGENVIKEAKQKAAEVIRAANIRAEDREQRARDEVELAQQELTTIRKETENFKKSLLAMYRKHIELLSKIPEASDTVEPQPEEETKSQPEPQPVQQPVYETPQPAYEPEPAFEQPSYEPPAYEEPAPVYEPAPVEEPLPEQQAEPYFDDPEEESLPETEEKVDTVEFAIAPKPDEPEDLREEPPAMAAPAPAASTSKFQPGAGLYDLPDEELPAPPKKTTRSKSTTRRSSTSTRRTKKQAQPDPLPASFDTFSGVDFDS